MLLRKSTEFFATTNEMTIKKLERGLPPVEINTVRMELEVSGNRTTTTRGGLNSARDFVQGKKKQELPFYACPVRPAQVEITECCCLMFLVFS